MKNLNLFLYVAIIFLISSCSHDKKEWRSTMEINSVQAFEEFIDKYPDSKYADSAKIRIWKNTISIGSINAFEKFIDNYPGSAYVDSANIRIKDLTYTRGALYSIGVSFSLGEAVGGEIKNLYYEKEIVLKKTDGKKIRAICPLSLINDIKGGQMLEVEFDKELNKYKVTKIIEDPK